MTPKGQGECSHALRTIWLTVASGGWWTLHDVRAEADVDEKIDIKKRLFELRQRGNVSARIIPKERRAAWIGRGSVQRLEYAVTPECRVPFGLTAGEITRALIGGKGAQ